MNYQELKQQFEQDFNPKKVKQLASYMRNQFEFYATIRHKDEQSIIIFF